MRLNEAARMLFGGAVVYVAMAACAGGSPTERPQELAGSGGAPMDDAGAVDGPGPIAEGGGGVSRGMLDALTDPVPDAKAALPPEVATEQCSVVVPIGDSGSSYLYAQHTFPGKTANDLAAVRFVAHYAARSGALTIIPAGFENTTSVYSIVRDGAVAVQCGPSGGVYYDSVTFILPN